MWCCWGYSSLLFCLPYSPSSFTNLCRDLQIKTPSKLKPIASLLCEKVMTYSDRFLPSYETKMKFIQGIIIQAVLTNLILFLVQLFHPKFAELIVSSIHSVIVETWMSYTIQRYKTRNKCIQIQIQKKTQNDSLNQKHSKIAIVVKRRRYWWYLAAEVHPLLVKALKSHF